MGGWGWALTTCAPSPLCCKNSAARRVVGWCEGWSSLLANPSYTTQIPAQLFFQALKRGVRLRPTTLSPSHPPSSSPPLTPGTRPYGLCTLCSHSGPPSLLWGALALPEQQRPLSETPAFLTQPNASLLPPSLNRRWQAASRRKRDFFCHIGAS